jgi:hypothetical protein
MHTTIFCRTGVRQFQTANIARLTIIRISRSRKNVQKKEYLVRFDVTC